MNTTKVVVRVALCIVATFIIILTATLLISNIINIRRDVKATEAKENQIVVSEQASVSESVPVEIIYFHSKRRCKTCIAIEKETMALVENELAQQVEAGKICFRKVDISTDEGKKLAAKYKVTFSSLFVVTEQGAEDLTKFAFANVKSDPEGFRRELKDKVLKAI